MTFLTDLEKQAKTKTQIKRKDEDNLNRGLK